MRCSPLTLIVTVLFAASASAITQTERALTNQDVIRLVKLGLSADVIVEKIGDSHSATT